MHPSKRTLLLSLIHNENEPQHSMCHAKPRLKMNSTIQPRHGVRFTFTSSLLKTNIIPKSMSVKLANSHSFHENIPLTKIERKY
jgi:hypothetical protein